MTEYEVSPRRMIIDLMRLSKNGSIAIKALIAAGDLFAFNESLIRVTITRLVSAGVVESVTRGEYRLCTKMHSKTEYVHAWREGEARIQKWDETWVSVHLPRKPNRNDRKKSLRVLDLLGFREVMDYLWLRPNNYKGGLSSTQGMLVQLGLEDMATIFVSERFQHDLVSQWVDDFWKPDSLYKAYQVNLNKLEQSERRVATLDLNQALLESFVTGGQAIHVLATDPMLPSELINTEDRARLSKAMQRYDELGREIWAQFPFMHHALGRAETSKLRRVK